MRGASGAPRLLGIYFISKMLTTTIQKIHKIFETYETNLKIYKDIKNLEEGDSYLPVPSRYKLTSVLQGM